MKTLYFEQNRWSQICGVRMLRNEKDLSSLQDSTQRWEDGLVEILDNSIINFQESAGALVESSISLNR